MHEIKCGYCYKTHDKWKRVSGGLKCGKCGKMKSNKNRHGTVVEGGELDFYSFQRTKLRELNGEDNTTPG